MIIIVLQPLIHVIRSFKTQFKCQSFKLKSGPLLIPRIDNVVKSIEHMRNKIPQWNLSSLSLSFRLCRVAFKHPSSHRSSQKCAKQNSIQWTWILKHHLCHINRIYILNIILIHWINLGCYVMREGMALKVFRMPFCYCVNECELVLWICSYFMHSNKILLNDWAVSAVTVIKVIKQRPMENEVNTVR